MYSLDTLDERLSHCACASKQWDTKNRKFGWAHRAIWHTTRSRMRTYYLSFYLDMHSLLDRTKIGKLLRKCPRASNIKETIFQMKTLNYHNLQIIQHLRIWFLIDNYLDKRKLLVWILNSMQLESNKHLFASATYF